MNEFYVFLFEIEDDFWGIDDRVIVVDFLLVVLEFKEKLVEVMKKFIIEE